MSLSVHLLDSVLDFSGAVSDEHEEQFHQKSPSMENRHQGKWSPSMLADYCWALRRDVPQAKYSRKITHCYVLGNVHTLCNII